MNTDSWKQVSELFAKVRELSPDERFDLLSDPDVEDTVRTEVEELLRFDAEESRGQTGPDLRADLTSFSALHSPEFDAGTRVGRYQLTRRIGRGASGVVYEAQQDQPARTVAVKVLPVAFLTGDGRWRFRGEAAALARLQHPGIAQVYEAGSARIGDIEAAFVAMEIVPNAAPFTQACSGLPVRERVECFAKVCDAVHHAHLRGVIHRDLKPANILVDGAKAEQRTKLGLGNGIAPPTRSDADELLTPKVIDFGVARLLDRADGGDEHTLRGAMVGTLQYMAPEQARGQTDSVDVRTDVYALGVILYRVLSGVMPYDVPNNVGAASAVIATAIPRQLSSHDRSLGGDIETIVRTALAKAQDDRYQSAAALAEDLRRWLGNLPILAKPPALTQRFVLWTKRNRSAAVLLGALLFSLLAGTFFGVRTTLETARQRRVAESVTAYLTRMLASPAASEKGKEVRVVDVLEAAEKDLPSLAGDPDALDHVQRTLAQSYEVLGDYTRALHLYEARLAALRARFGDRHVRVIDATFDLSGPCYDLGEYNRAEQLLRGVLAARTARWGPGDISVADAHNGLALVLMEKDKDAEADQHLRSAIAIRRVHPKSTGAKLAQSLCNLGVMRRHAGDNAEAIDLFEEAVKIQESLGEPEFVELANTRRFLALALLDSGQLERAEVIARGAITSVAGALGEAHESTAGAYVALARILHRKGANAAALGFYEKSVASYWAALGSEHPFTKKVSDELAGVRAAIDALPR